MDQTVKGHLPEIDRNGVVFYFRPLFHTRCSLLTKIVCSSLVPLCLPSRVVLPCRDVCFSVYTSCHYTFLQQSFEWCLCLSPPSPTPLFSVPSATSVRSTSSSPSALSLSFVSLFYNTGPAAFCCKWLILTFLLFRP